MQFEYDDTKSESNKQKHGIDFEIAQAIWDDEAYIRIPSSFLDEPRFVCIGLIEGRHYSAVVIYRGENIRIISVRRARKEEVELYEG